MLAWKAQHNIALKYLSDLLLVKQYNRNLRANIRNHIIIPKTNNVSCSDRAFVKAAPNLWNKLPESLQHIDKLNSFKTKLKTRLFTTHYSNIAS